LFKKATGQSPSRYYRSLRMKAARQLVLYSKQSLVNIALAVGYETVGPLQSYYRQEFGISPNADRIRINRLRVEEARPLPAI
jgi:transcriptional regulator GlxA family with amidase domain